MSRSALSGHPLLLGLDRIDHLLDRMVTQTGDGYPPFNVEQPAEHALRIELAVAGFAPEELSVQVEGGELVVRGRRSERRARTYLYRGIAARQFKRVFRLADGLETDSAHLENGILSINIRRMTTITPVRKIAIQTAGPIDGDGGSKGQQR